MMNFFEIICDQTSELVDLPLLVSTSQIIGLYDEQEGTSSVPFSQLK